MKLLHISDWHLGRTLYGASRAEDHEKVLEEIVEIGRRERPDLVVHTGYLFESIRPAYEDMDRGIRALQALAEVAPVVVLCGNHDSPALLRLFNKLLGETSRIQFVDRARAADAGGILTFGSRRGETVRLGVLPFVHANRMVPAFENSETWMAAYADRIKLIQENLWDGLNEGANFATDVLLFATHLHVAGATFSRSERPIHITDTYASRVEHVPKVSYAAFGHIHKPQQLPGSENGWYAGSPIPLDFGEAGEGKVVVVVEAEPGRPPNIQPVSISGGRALRISSHPLAAPLRALGWPVVTSEVDRQGMWTVIRFALSSAEPGPYRAAFELLGRSGFQPHRRPGPGACAVFPASVVADLLQDPAVVSRAIFEALAEARLRPVMVTGAHVEVRARARPASPVGPR